MRGVTVKEGDRRIARKKGGGNLVLLNVFFFGQEAIALVSQAIVIS